MPADRGGRPAQTGLLIIGDCVDADAGGRIAAFNPQDDGLTRETAGIFGGGEAPGGAHPALLSAMTSGIAP